jgi:hypothetical protein
VVLVVLGETHKKDEEHNELAVRDRSVVVLGESRPSKKYEMS